MVNKKELLKDDITKLIDGKSLDDVIESLQELRNHSYGCEVIRLIHSINMQPIVCLYDVVNEIPSNAVISRNPEIKEKTSKGTYSVVPTLKLDSLPFNFFMDISYFADVYQIKMNNEEERKLIERVKGIYNNTRTKVFVKYGEGTADAVDDGVIAGFTIINLDSIISDKLEISVYNPYHIRFLIGKSGSKARELADQINKELKYDQVKFVKFINID